MLKSLMIRKKIDDAKKRRDLLNEKAEELNTREAELADAVREANTEEEKEAVTAAVEKFDAEKAENGAEIERIDKEIESLEAELAEVEARQDDAAGSKEEPAKKVERNNSEVRTMHKRIAEMTMEQRAAFVEREDVKAFVAEIRNMVSGQKRSVNGGEYLIPTVVVELLRQVIEDTSKLLKYVNVQRVSGKARQPVMGLIPEAVWTEQCGKINELNLSFSQVEVDGFKVGGFVAVCNALLEDSDINLVDAVVSAIGKAIGIALDKAIIFGTGVKMPTGIFTKLPSDNIKSIANTVKGAAFFAEFNEDASIADSDYATGGMFWAMNKKTKAAIVTQAVTFDASGAVVASVNDSMPVIGGDIVELSFMPDNVVVGGYGELYLLAERAGTSIKTSEEVHFLEDETVFKGTARYDGKPSIEKAFVAIGIKGTTPSASGVTFAPDTANTASEVQAAG